LGLLFCGHIAASAASLRRPAAHRTSTPRAQQCDSDELLMKF